MSDAETNADPTDAASSVGAVRSHDLGNPKLSPLEGGQWRPVSPDELLKRTPATDEVIDEEERQNRQRVHLERRQELEHKLKSNPTDLDGFLELASIYRHEHRPLEAKRLLKQASQIFPDDVNVTFQLEEAVLARSLQQFREVSELAARLNSPEADRELERSRSDWAMRRIEVCHARLERDPSQVSLRLSLAEAKYDAEIFEDAFEEAGRLLEMDELSAQAHFLRARCLLALGKELAAMKELRAVSLRRAVVAPEKLRLLSLRMLCELADKLSLSETGNQYRLHLQKLEASLQQSNL